MTAAGGAAHGPRRDWRGTGAVVAVVAIGGAIGSLLRYEAGVLWPTPVGTFPTTILVVNLVGCLVIGVFLVFVDEVRRVHHPLVRPFLATGILGGFTTFSTYSLDILSLVQQGRPALAIGYLFGTAIGAMLAVTAGMVGTRRLFMAGKNE